MTANQAPVSRGRSRTWLQFEAVSAGLGSLAAHVVRKYRTNSTHVELTLRASVEPFRLLEQRLK